MSATNKMGTRAASVTTTIKLPIGVANAMALSHTAVGPSDVVGEDVTLSDIDGEVDATVKYDKTTTREFT